MIACGNCGTDNPAAARFCMSCGHSIEIPCPSCETALPADARFCFNCGTQLVAGATDDQQGQSAQEVTSAIADQLREVTRGAGERRTITMMFCDIKDSTATAERLDPESWSAIMREAMDAFVAAVERYEGTVARLLGDAILAYFGAPVAHEDDPQRALLAALMIRDTTRELTERVRAEHGTEFDVRIGINTGLVVVGDVGSDQANEYAALGDAANVAARMEQTAPAGTIRIAEHTHRLIAPLFEVEPVGAIAVKGRTEPVEAFTVLAALGQPGQVRGITGISCDLVGRDDEIALLREAADAARSGSGRIVSIVGEAGLGKSRLVAELREELGDSVRWFRATSHSYETATPYAPFIHAFDEELGLSAELDPGERTEQALAQLTQLLGEERRDDALAACMLMGLPLEPEDEKVFAFMEPPVLRGRIFAAMTAIVEAQAARGPVVLQLEDLHWADPTSIELAEHLLSLTERTRLLLLLLFRPRRDEPSWGVHVTAEREHAHRHLTVVLAPLDEAHASELVTQLLRVDGLSERVRMAILEKSEGNPFFVEEVIRSMLDEGVIVREGDRFVTTRELTDIAVPDTLAAVLGARLDRLDEDTRQVIRTAAVLGREFSVDTLEQLTDPGIDLATILDDLQRRELLVERTREPDLRLAFKHALTRDTAYETLLVSVRQDLHRIVGTLIEEQHPDRVFELARHFREADEPARAVPYLVAAGEQAFAAFARQDAADLFAQAIERWDDTMALDHARRAREGLGNARMFLGDIDGSLAAFDELIEFSRAHDDPVGEMSAFNKSGLVMSMGTGDTAAAESRLLAAKELAESIDSQAGLAEFHVGYCNLNITRGRLDEAEKHLGEAAEVCFTLDAHHRNFGLVHYAESLIYQTKFEEAIPALERARSQATEDEDWEHVAEAIFAQGFMDFWTGDVAESVASADEAVALANRVGAAGSAWYPSWLAGHTRISLGRLDEARVLLEQNLEEGAASQNPMLSIGSLAGLALLECWQSGPGSPGVDETLAQVNELAQIPLALAFTGVVRTTFGVCSILAGDHEAAERELSIADATPNPFSKLVEPELYICRSSIALDEGRIDDADALALEGLELVESRRLHVYRGRMLMMRGAAVGASGDAAAMAALLAEAEADALARGMRLDAILIQRGAVKMLTAAGMEEESAAARERLGESIADVAASLTDSEMRRDFLRTNAMVG